MLTFVYDKLNYLAHCRATVMLRIYVYVMSVGAVTVFVDVCSFYMVHQYTFPVVLDNCCRGWVNNIVLTSSGPLQVSLNVSDYHITWCMHSGISWKFAGI